MTPIPTRKNSRRDNLALVLAGRISPLILALTCLSLTTFVMAESSPSEDEWNKWLKEDFEQQANQVNEGQIHFLPDAPANQDSHAIEHHISITAASLLDQWVSFRQCHTHLDPVAQSQIVYRYKNMRNLRIEHAEAIGKSWVENQSIQMEDLQPGASICILAEAQILKPTKVEGKKAFSLINGPYYRKFLDGYYPFHIRFTIDYPAELLSVAGTSPKPQAGVVVLQETGLVQIETWFEGKLKIGIIFQPLANTSQ